MPMERLAVLAAIQTSKHSHNSDNSTSEGGYYPQGYNTSNGGSGKTGRYETDLNENVNVLLGGAMMSGVIIVVVLICYCCHRNIRKNRPQEYSPYWRPEPDVHSLEVFTTHAICYGQQTSAGTHHEEETVSLQCPSSLGPPPTYDSLIFNPHSPASPSNKKNEPLIPDENLDVPKETKSEQDTKEMPAFKENEGLPTYEVALKLEADGYV